MTDKFYPTPVATLLKLVLSSNDEILGIPKELFFIPEQSDPFKVYRYRIELETPLGVAAGPHTQMAQNLIAAWLCGARYMELKTVQTLDELSISKPCIDIQDEGFNCEWSQELRIHESFEEYLKAWIIIHILRHHFGWKKEMGTIFNMSVGYNMEGILNENVQWFFRKMNNCQTEKEQLINEIRQIYPKITEIEIPDQISNNITLSTMHGCPPHEIEKIGLYLIEQKRLHTTIKLNPTLLGAQTLRHILNNTLHFENHVPDSAFGHDLKYEDALPIIRTLWNSAKTNHVDFSLKLSNTLETVNRKNIFSPENEMMYMSGRALHPLTVELARKLQNEFNGELDISFAGGADCFNTPALVASGLSPVTVCSDLLKPGGYGRLHQYLQILKEEFAKKQSKNIEEFIIKYNIQPQGDWRNIALRNLNLYADTVATNTAYQKTTFQEPSIKTNRKLGYFDCISAPCQNTCPTHQNIPDYLYFTSRNEFESAYETIMKTNPFPSITGMICDHTCQLKCSRMNYDQSLQIREIKRFISEQGRSEAENSGLDKQLLKNESFQPKDKAKKAVIIGAGPSGLSCAWFLRLGGLEVDVFEQYNFAGGTIATAIPAFRLKNETVLEDVKRIESTGVNIYYNHKVTAAEFKEFCLNYDYIYIAAGALKAIKLDIQGIDATSVLDPLKFLYDAKTGTETGIGKNVAIIGGGNSAMDAARTAFRLVGEDGKVTIVYRRTIKEMPADLGEIEAVIAEGINIRELTSPEQIISENGRVNALVCSKMKLSEKDDSGRSKPVKIQGSEFELAFDTIIPAIGQTLNIDFVDVNELKPITGFRTKLNHVFIGGDALRGGDTAIQAVADGRMVAETILKEIGFHWNSDKKNNKALSVNELKLKRAFRKYPVNIPETPLHDRKNFNLLSSTFTKEQALNEANRCLFCDELCNICVTVCPNLSNYSYTIQPTKIDIYQVSQQTGKLSYFKQSVLEVNQTHQIVNLKDWCNECGNCSTFCPTSGAPYKDKPQVYITKEAFDLADSGFYVSKKTDSLIIQKKFQNKISQIEKNKKCYIYENELLTAIFNLSDSCELIVTTPKNNNDFEVVLEDVAIMQILMEGLKELMNN
jgi:putative selenate reductase